jgi:hypothetical protein
MTELSFLIELLLNHDLKKETKDAVAARIREVEGSFHKVPTQILAPQYTQTLSQPMPSGIKQAPSTLALMAKHGDIPPVPIPPPIESPPPPVLTEAQIAQRQAMLGRQKNKPLSTR